MHRNRTQNGDDAVVKVVVNASDCRRFVRGEFVMKRERDEHNHEMEIVYDSRSKEYMMTISCIILRILWAILQATWGACFVLDQTSSFEDQDEVCCGYTSFEKRDDLNWAAFSFMSLFSICRNFDGFYICIHLLQSQYFD